MHKQEGGTLDETALVVDGRQKILMGPLNLYNEYVAVDRTRKLAGFIALHEKKKSITRIVALMWWRALRLDNVPTLSAFSIPIAKRRVWESGSWGVRMKDHELVLRALNKAELIVGDYLESGHPRDPVATINRLIEVLDDQMLAAAIKRMENGYGLKLYPILASSQSQRRRSWFQN
jgi:hypothetical protein